MGTISLYHFYVSVFKLTNSVFHIVCFISSAFNAFFISFTEFFSSKIFVWFFFRVSISSVKYSSCSLILFLSSLNCLSEFYCSSFMTTIFNSLSVRMQYCLTLSLVSGELSFSFCDTVLPWFFMVLDELFLYWYIWSSEHPSSLDKAFFFFKLDYHDSTG